MTRKYAGASHSVRVRVRVCVRVRMCVRVRVHVRVCVHVRVHVQVHCVPTAEDAAANVCACTCGLLLCI